MKVTGQRLSSCPAGCLPKSAIHAQPSKCLLELRSRTCKVVTSRVGTLMTNMYMCECVLELQGVCLLLAPWLLAYDCSKLRCLAACVSPCSFPWLPARQSSVVARRSSIQLPYTGMYYGHYLLHRMAGRAKVMVTVMYSDDITVRSGCHGPLCAFYILLVVLRVMLWASSHSCGNCES